MGKWWFFLLLHSFFFLTEKWNKNLNDFQAGLDAMTHISHGLLGFDFLQKRPTELPFEETRR